MQHPTLPTIGRRANTPHIDQTRAVDGCRSPWFYAHKRRVKFTEGSVVVLELAEQRVYVIPWLRIPVYSHWRKRLVRGLDVNKLGICARLFLDTGHVPAQWWI